MKKVKVERDVDIGSFKVGGGNPFFSKCATDL